MKRCGNNNCRTDFLFGDNKTICPFCGRILLDNDEQSTTTSPIFSNDIIRIPEIRTDIEFIRTRGHKIECHGEIIELDHQEVFNSRFHKIINAIFRGEPYQFAHQTMEYVIRVREIADGYADEVVDFHLFGNYMGKFQVGDEVDLKARVSGNRNIVTSVYNESTSQRISGGICIPANMIRLLFLIITVSVVLILTSLIVCIKSGVYTEELLSILLVVGIIMISFGWIRNRFLNRGRRRWR